MNNVAYIYSHDGDEHGIKFSVQMCTEATLRETVQKHLCPDGEDLEFPGLYEALLATGSHDFEDGWVVIKRGQEIIDFLIYQLHETKAEEQYAWQMRAQDAARRAIAEEKYRTLQTALTEALGPQGPEIAAKAAA